MWVGRGMTTTRPFNLKHCITIINLDAIWPGPETKTHTLYSVLRIQDLRIPELSRKVNKVHTPNVYSAIENVQAV